MRALLGHIYAPRRLYRHFNPKRKIEWCFRIKMATFTRVYTQQRAWHTTIGYLEYFNATMCAPYQETLLLHKSWKEDQLFASIFVVCTDLSQFATFVGHHKAWGGASFLTLAGFKAVNPRFMPSSTTKRLHGSMRQNCSRFEVIKKIKWSLYQEILLTWGLTVLFLF